MSLSDGVGSQMSYNFTGIHKLGSNLNGEHFLTN